VAVTSPCLFHVVSARPKRHRLGRSGIAGRDLAIPPISGRSRIMSMPNRPRRLAEMTADCGLASALVPAWPICYILRRCLDAQASRLGVLPNAVVAELVDALA
jgi:hypothetical protein